MQRGKRSKLGEPVSSTLQSLASEIPQSARPSTPASAMGDMLLRRSYALRESVKFLPSRFLREKFAYVFAFFLLAPLCSSISDGVNILGTGKAPRL